MEPYSILVLSWNVGGLRFCRGSGARTLGQRVRREKCVPVDFIGTLMGIVDNIRQRSDDIQYSYFDPHDRDNVEDNRVFVTRADPNFIVISTEDEADTGSYLHSDVLTNYMRNSGYRLYDRQVVRGVGEISNSRRRYTEVLEPIDDFSASEFLERSPRHTSTAGDDSGPLISPAKTSLRLSVYSRESIPRRISGYATSLVLENQLVGIAAIYIPIKNRVLAITSVSTGNNAIDEPLRNESRSIQFSRNVGSIVKRYAHDELDITQQMDYILMGDLGQYSYSNPLSVNNWPHVRHHGATPSGNSIRSRVNREMHDRILIGSNSQLYYATYNDGRGVRRFYGLIDNDTQFSNSSHLPLCALIAFDPRIIDTSIE